MRRIPMLLAAAALAFASGCATSSGMKYQPSSYRATLDTGYIATVESAANAAGARVTWVHPPRKAKQTPQ
jgi:hypothetical protein